MQTTLQVTATKVQLNPLKPELQNPLKLKVQTAIQSKGYWRLKRVRVDVVRETVTLSGTLKTFYLKQLAQEISKKVPGVSRVVNDIEVKS